jgi:hypothetical protein
LIHDFAGQFKQAVAGGIARIISERHLATAWVLRCKEPTIQIVGILGREAPRNPVKRVETEYGLEEWDRLDSSKGIGYPCREEGSYGSYPSHDGFDDESDP